MTRYTKALRQKIVREFAVRHNGIYNPARFVDEVRRAGKKHPAHGWFTWDASKAAKAHWLQEARDFARDLRVVFTVEQVGRRKPLTVKQTEMPMVISPMSGRHRGGGYVLVQSGSEEHIAEHCLQAAMALDSWLSRYASALAHIGESTATIVSLANKLRLARVDKSAA